MVIYILKNINHKILTLIKSSYHKKTKRDNLNKQMANKYKFSRL